MNRGEIDVSEKFHQLPRKCSALFTIQPLGVVLGGAQWRHVPQAPVDDGIPTGEVDHRGGVQLAPLRYHGGGVVAGVIGASGNTVHCVQHLTDVTNLNTTECRK